MDVVRFGFYPPLLLTKAMIETISVATAQNAMIQSLTTEKPILRPRDSAVLFSTLRKRSSIFVSIVFISSISFSRPFLSVSILLFRRDSAA